MYWLKNNKDPFETILKYWKETVEFRKRYFEDHLTDKNISEILVDWPNYKLPQGAQLVIFFFYFCKTNIMCEIKFKNIHFIRLILTLNTNIK